VSESDRFLSLAGLELIKQEGLRLVKAPPSGHEERAWEGTPSGYPWEDWDEVLVGDGPGVRPSIFVLRSASGLGQDQVRALYDGLIERIAGGRLVRTPQGMTMPLRVVVIYSFDSIPPRDARRLAQTVPDRYYSNLKPEVWVVDLSQARLWAPKALGLFPSRAQAAVKQALQELSLGHAQVDEHDLARAEAATSSQRDSFVSTVRRNEPYVTYALLLIIWFVFLLEARAPPVRGCNGCSWLTTLPGKTLLQFGAMRPKLIERGEVWRLFTDMFVHVDIVHILFNSVALYSIGTLVERIYGAVRYAIIYFVSGLFASLASFAYMAVVLHQPNQIAAGASGAIFGIAGVVIVLGIVRHSLVPRAVALQLSVFMGVLILLNLGFDQITPGIDTRAHVGGLLMGLILGYFLAPKSATTGGVRSTELAG
jgi:membrane associated rhomboid family serine protease